MSERGTAKELNLQVGDIVTWGMRLVDVPFNPSAYWNKPNKIFTLISRAKKSIESNELTWGEMSDAEKGALLLAHQRGDVVERDHGYGWVTADNPLWINSNKYRIKSKEPVVEEVSLHFSADSPMTLTRSPCDTHRLKYNIIDGVIDCDSVEMEEL